MNKTNIEWCDYTINPVKGLCPMACSYCYARAMYKRFKWNPEIRFDWGWAEDNYFPHDSKVFVGSTMELFGDWIKPEWLEFIFYAIRQFPKTTFLILTKESQNLIKWSPFPENCWVGVSATNDRMTEEAVNSLAEIKASVKFISFEPLLDSVNGNYADILDMVRYVVNWVIIGQQTPVRKATMPKIEWVQEIVEACDKTGIPVFLKDNLKPLMGNNLRQEFPNNTPIH